MRSNVALLEGELDLPGQGGGDGPAVFPGRDEAPAEQGATGGLIEQREAGGAGDVHGARPPGGIHMDEQVDGTGLPKPRGLGGIGGRGVEERRGRAGRNDMGATDDAGARGADRTEADRGGCGRRRFGR